MSFVNGNKFYTFLPYFVSENDIEKYNYKDEQKFLDEDKREMWWKKYSFLKGKEYNGLPEELNRGTLIEVTSQPLLNYLVALSFIRDKLDFFSKKQHESDLCRFAQICLSKSLGK